MAIDVYYKDNIITSFGSNTGKILNTAGKFMEDDVTILGTTNLQSKIVNPTKYTQLITADSEYDGLSSVQVNAAKDHIAIINDTGAYSTCCVYYDSTMYYQDGQSFGFNAGETLIINSGGSRGGGTIKVNDVQVIASQDNIRNYSYTLPDYDIIIDLSYGSGGVVNVVENTPKEATISTTLETASSSISFDYLSGDPIAFIIYAAGDLATGASPFKVNAIVFDGTDLHGQIITNTNNAQVTYDNTSFSKTYSNRTLTITSTGPQFQAMQYILCYAHRGTTTNVRTANVQVGSGATSITFDNLDENPLNCCTWSCIFKSNFSTSNGYQRTIEVMWIGGEYYGHAMDSSSHYYADVNAWSASYSNGSFTITSNSTTKGGYFHQPGYYQLTYIVPSESNGSSGGNGAVYQAKTVTPTESQQIVSADSGYTGLSTVTVNAISNTYVGSGITRRSSSDLSASGATVTVPAGYYASQATKSVSTTTHPNPTASINSSTGLVTASHTQTAGYVSAGTTTGTLQLTTQAAKTVTPTTSSQTAVAAGRYTTGVVTVAAIPSNYVDSSTLKTYYTGSSAPSSSLGANGDLYFQSTGA